MSTWPNPYPYDAFEAPLPPPLPATPSDLELELLGQPRADEELGE